jgi:intracellular sulfur oxidation DsrE/DsrF family protein
MIIFKKYLYTMRKAAPVFLLLLMGWYTGFSQEVKSAKDSANAAKQARKFQKFLQMAEYPLIKGDPMSGVLPVPIIDEWPDTNQVYKLLFVWTYGSRDSAKLSKNNPALADIGRIVNLHIASHIPLSHLQLVSAVHGPSIFSLLTDAAYEERFHRKNPNSKLIEELQHAGVKFIACGQAMGFLEVKKADLMPGINVALTAQSIITSYEMKGFVAIDESSE